VDALREIFTRRLDHDGANRYLTGMISGAYVRYDLGFAQDLVGRCHAPDLTVRLPSGRVPRLAALQRSGRALLIGAGDAAAGGWEGRVDTVAGSCDWRRVHRSWFGRTGSSRGRPTTPSPSMMS
jgi:hypothetical protein